MARARQAWFEQRTASRGLPVEDDLTPALLNSEGPQSMTLETTSFAEGAIEVMFLQQQGRSVTEASTAWARRLNPKRPIREAVIASRLRATGSGHTGAP
jgi:hypothetical protein